MSNQRKQYRLLKSGKKSFISNEMIVQLEIVGFQWNSDRQLALNTAWNERLSELLDFKQQWRHCDVPQKYYNDINLVKWVII